jgi:hypothetical protein
MGFEAVVNRMAGTIGANIEYGHYEVSTRLHASWAQPPPTASMTINSVRFEPVSGVFNPFVRSSFMPSTRIMTFERNRLSASRRWYSTVSPCFAERALMKSPIVNSSGTSISSCLLLRCARKAPTKVMCITRWLEAFNGGWLRLCEGSNAARPSQFFCCAGFIYLRHSKALQDDRRTPPSATWAVLSRIARPLMKFSKS